jgi:hypothetical protein
MKSFCIALLMFSKFNLFPQSASSYFPENSGTVWRYKMVALDTLNNPIDTLVVFRVDSFATNAFIYNKDAKVVLSKTGDDPFLYQEPFSDTILYNFEGSIGNEYLGMSQLQALIDFLSSFLQDTTGGVINFFKSFEGWKSNYRFASAVNTQYIILQRDTTFTVDTLVLPLRFQILGRRLNDQTIQTEIGSFVCKKFTLERRLSYLVPLPPPIPPLAVKIVGFLDTLWIAPQNWIVKTFAPSTTIDLSFVGLGTFSIPGFKMDIHNPPLSVDDNISIVSDFVLHQNYPNPFGNVSGSNKADTKISWIQSTPGWVSLKLFNSIGEEIETLAEGYFNSGNYTINYSANSNLSAGIYFYQLRAENIVITKKMLLIK